MLHFGIFSAAFIKKSVHTQNRTEKREEILSPSANY
jgi:hypothetical protein